MIFWQVLVVLLTLASIWYVQDSRPLFRRFGSICGVLQQPIWFYIGWTTGAWASCVLAPVFAIVWMRGLRKSPRTVLPQA